MMEVDTEPWGWSSYFDNIKIFLQDLRRKFGICNRHFAEYAVERLQFSIGSVTLVVDQLNIGLQGQRTNSLSAEERQIVLFYRGQLEELIVYLQQIVIEWHTLKDALDTNQRPPYAYQATTISTGARGRPRFQLRKEQLEYLRSLSFSWNDISEILGISRMTLFRYRRDFNMTNEPQQSVTDHQLRVIISQLRLDMPNVGETIVMGHLRASGYSVTRERMRQVIRATDPINTSLRWRGNLSQRRPYSVPGPNSLWHIGKVVNEPFYQELIIVGSCFY